MTGQLTALQTETAESDSTPNPDDQPPATDQTDMNTPGSPLSTNTPTPVEAMKPTGPGICGRSPEIQRTLLAHLNISLCHAVTTPELFRITEFGVAMNSAQQGDFEGLVNVQHMSISANKFEPRALRGLGCVDILVMMLVCQMLSCQQNNGTGFSISCVAAPACMSLRKKIASDLSRPFCGLTAPAPNGDCFRPNTGIGTVSINDSPVGLTKASGNRCFNISPATRTWNT